jgi:putative ABC transport system permease protein
MIDRLRSELVTAYRALVATPIPVLAAVLTLAVAVGVNLAMLGLIDRALLAPPAHVSQPSDVFTLGFHISDDAADARTMTTTSWVTYAAIRDQVPALTSAAFQRGAVTMVIDGDQRQANAMIVSEGYFDVLGARPTMGPGMVQGSDSAADPVVVLSDHFWRSVLAGDRAVVGRRIKIRDLEYRIAGVMPAGFTGHSATDVDLWIPFAAAMQGQAGWDRDAHRNILSIVVRLAAGHAQPAAEAQAGAAIARRVTMSPIVGADVAATEARVAWWLSGVSVLVLIIGLANSGTLLVARAMRRRHDVAVRAALGASRARLIGQAVAEAVVLAIVATALSLALAPSLDELLRRVLFPGVVAGSGLRMATVVTAACAGLVAAIVAAAANLWQLPPQTSPADLAIANRGGTRRTKTVTALLLVQTALSMLLLTGAGLFAASFYNLASQDFGMQMDGVVLADFEQGPGGTPGQGRIFGEVLPQIRALPGVAMATVIDALPFSGFNVPPISVPGHAEAPNVGGQLPYLTAATPEFFSILGIKIIEGRPFAESDERGPFVVIVNQAMAQGVWPGESAIGKCIRIGFDPDFDPEFSSGLPTPTKVPCRTVIGVARDTRQRSLVPTGNEARLMQYFVPFSQVPTPPFAPVAGPPVRGLLIRTTSSADALAAPIRRIVVGQRPNVSFVRVQPYVNLLDRQMQPWRLGTTLLAWFSALALGVAAIGLYAAFAHAVGERRREMAIRLAIGAKPSGVLTMILRESLTLAAVGIVVGCIGTAIAGRWIQSLLFGTAPSNPLVLSAAALVMLIVAAGATWLPARAASKVEPRDLLRAE